MALSVDRKAGTEADSHSSRLSTVASDLGSDVVGVGLCKLDQNVMLFVRLLRASGLKLGPRAMLDAVRCVQLVGLENKAYFYHSLSASLLTRHEDKALFDQAFYLFWRNPKFIEQMRNALLPQMKALYGELQKNMKRRLEDALGQSANTTTASPQRAELQIDARHTASDREVFQNKDFEMMSSSEWAEAEQAIAQMIVRFPTRPMRRLRPHMNGRVIDFRTSLRAARKRGGLVLPHYRQPMCRMRPVVVMCDISGSMESYSRMMLHFMHMLTRQSPVRVASFLFGTQLTAITRLLQNRDIDDSIAAVARTVPDWSGGTRISTSLAAFNHIWSRRVLGQGAIVLLMTDGLDRDVCADLNLQIDRLHKSCAELIWLNPLLRYDGFAPKSRSVQTMLAHVDRFLPVHSLQALSQLATLLSGQNKRSYNDVSRWQAQARQLAAHG